MTPRLHEIKFSFSLTNFVNTNAINTFQFAYLKPVKLNFPTTKLLPFNLLTSLS